VPLTSALRLVGDNTDWIGFLNDLRWHSVDLSQAPPAQALILGAGGSARAIVYALANCGLPVTVLNRDASRAERLVASLQPNFPKALMRAGALAGATLSDAVASGSGATCLIVNCTSAGMSPNMDTSPWLDGVPFPNGAVLYDLVYKPAETRLMRQAQAAGLRVIGGIGMLAEQGAAAFERWTSICARQVSGVMREALAQAQ
jgi:shikimate dehydrogenase